MLLDRLHRARSTRTIDAYNADLADFARWQGRGREQAVGLLLAGGPDNARRTALTFAAYLRRQERAQATIERRLSTLAVLVAEAEEAGLIDWRLAIRD